MCVCERAKSSLTYPTLSLIYRVDIYFFLFIRNMSTSAVRLLRRDYQAEAEAYSCKRTASSENPLSMSILSSSRNDGIDSGLEDEIGAMTISEESPEQPSVEEDPLGAMALAGGDFDPLGAMGAKVVDIEETWSPANGSSTSANEAGNETENRRPEDVLKELWEPMKTDILKKYTVSGKIVVTTSFMTGEGRQEDVGPSAEPADKMKARLKKLENETAEDTMEVSQKQYMNRIEELHKNLTEAWKENQRVEALKIAIQCAKMMLDTTVIAFYPSMFVLLTGVLETFGDLVFERIKERSEEVSGQKLSKNFLSSDVAVEAKETCRNWFYKTACIRELLPRLYIELCVTKCYKFLTDGEFKNILNRIANIIRGVGDPLVAIWVRVYLARVGKRTLPEDTSFVKSTLFDYLFTWSQFNEKAPGLKTLLSEKGVSYKEYLRLHEPAVSWLCQCVGKSASKEDFKKVLEHYRDYCGNSLVLKHIILEFDSKYWSASAAGMVQLIKDAKSSHVHSAELFEALGIGISKNPPPANQRMSVLNETWKIVTKFDKLEPYASCTAAWIDMALKHYQEKHVLILLKDLVRHVRAEGDGSAKRIVVSLERVVTSVTKHSNSFGEVLTSQYFLQLLDLFRSEKKTDMCKELLLNFTKSNETTSDPVVIATVFDIARSLHDSLDSLSVDDERKQISDLLCRFVTLIDFGNNLEQQLNILVDCRAAFPNLDSVKDRLVLSVVHLAARAHAMVKGKHNRKTSAFVKACLACCHITIPSIDNVFRRLYLFLHCGQVALINGCLPQTDTFFKAAISIIPDIPQSTNYDYDRQRLPSEPRLLEFFKSFLSSLIIVPGHPEHGPFYLIKGLRNAVSKYEWKEGHGGKTELFIYILPVLSAWSQRKLPYCIDSVDSNDSLFGGNALFLGQCADQFVELFDEILVGLSEGAEYENGNDKAKKRCADLIVLLVNVLVVNVDLSESSKICKVIKKMMDKARGYNPTSPFLDETLRFITSLGNGTSERSKARGGQNEQLMAKLAGSLKVSSF